jgi:diguanylate cyclase (GGDEF)-like protein
MKVTGARSQAFSAIRGRAAAKAAADPAAPARVDSAAFLGVSEAEMTPAVQAAIQALVGEIEGLRGEVGRLKARLAQAEGLADRDSLTPLLNRRAFLRELGRVAAFARRYGAAASLVYFDLDGFKAINDRHGHAAGDAALQAVAGRLAANVRESDVLGRLGGDEFALILAQADAPTAQAKAAALAQAVEREPIRFGERTAPVRLSWGVAEVSPDLDAEALVGRADAAMFAAKRLRKAG